MFSQTCNASRHQKVKHAAARHSQGHGLEPSSSRPRVCCLPFLLRCCGVCFTLTWLRTSSERPIKTNGSDDPDHLRSSRLRSAVLSLLMDLLSCDRAMIPAGFGGAVADLVSAPSNVTESQSSGIAVATRTLLLLACLLLVVWSHADRKTIPGRFRSPHSGVEPELKTS